MNNRKDLIYVVLFILAALVLFPIIGKLIGILLVAALIFFAYVYFKSRSLKKEIEKDPTDYFSQQLYRQQREKETVSADVIDAEYKEKEIERLTAEKQKLEGEIKRVESKLSNESFVAKAPQKIVEEEKEKGEKYKDMLKKVLESLENLK